MVKDIGVRSVGEGISEAVFISDRHKRTQSSHKSLIFDQKRIENGLVQMTRNFSPCIGKFREEGGLI